MKGVECEAILKIRHCELPKVARQSAFIPLSTQTHNTHTPTPLPGEGKNKTMLYSLRAWQSEVVPKKWTRAKRQNGYT